MGTPAFYRLGFCSRFFPFGCLLYHLTWIFSPAGQLPSILLGLLIVPVVDLLRVITLRVFAGKSPFHRIVTISITDCWNSVGHIGVSA